MSNKTVQDVVTGKVRLSFVHLFTPYASRPGAEAKYSVTLLIPKSDAATKQRIDAALNAAIQFGVSDKWRGVRPPILSLPIHDGDGVRPSDGMPFGPECKGHWVVTASSKQAVEIVDLGMNPILNQTEVYSGMYARVSIRFFPFDQSGKKGIGCGLGPVQKLEDGEPLGSRISAAAAFGDQAAAAPAYPAQPVYGPPYQQPVAPQQYQQATAAPAYPAALPYGYPGYAPGMPPAAPQPAYPAQPVQLDPITGKPLVGGVMGLGQ